MKENVARRPRFRRVFDLSPIRLTERDRAILAAVSRFRFLTTSLILSIVPGSRQNIQRRLQRLYHFGFLDRPRAQLSLRYSAELSELVYCPSRKTDAGKGYRPTTSLFLAHALMVSEVLNRIEANCRTRGTVFISEGEILSAANPETPIRHIQWRAALKSGSATEHVGVIPDAVFAIEDAEAFTGRRYFFVEVDRGTMPIHRNNLRNSSIRRKVLAYARTRRGRMLEERFEIPGFQVLFVAHSKERMMRIEEACHMATEGHSSSLFIFKTIGDFRVESAALDFLYPPRPANRLPEIGVI